MRWCGLLAVGLATSGCVRAGFEVSGPGSDVSVRKDAGPSPFGRGRWSFGPIERVEELNSAEVDVEVSLPADGLSVYFSSGRPGGPGVVNVYLATRSSRSSPFGAPALLPTLNGPTSTFLTVTGKGLTGFLLTDRAGGQGQLDIWLGVRPSVTAPWEDSIFRPQPQLNSDRDEFDPFPTADGLLLYFSRYSTPDAGVSSQQKIAVAERSSPTADFGSPHPLEGVNSASYDEADPALSPDQRVIVFTSTRPGAAGGSADLWYAVRSDLSQPFSDPVPLTALNTPYADGEAFITADGSELWFCSDRPGGKGATDIYRVPILEGP